jgi:ubiquitin-activating enzyme E1
LCWNALDNVHARKYTDKMCLWHSKPLLESGTLGTKCNSDIILPYRTKSYNDGKESDDNEAQIAMCTLRSFPFLPLHCIEFAKVSSFGEVFEFGPQQYEDFRRSPYEFFERLEAMGEGEKLSALRIVRMLVNAQEGGQVRKPQQMQRADAGIYRIAAHVF